jgi:hypothetical protein
MTTGLPTESAREEDPSGFAWSLVARGAGLPGQLLRREPEGSGQGVTAHRHRRLHPVGHRGHRPRTGERHAHGWPPRPGAQALPTPRRGGAGRPDPQLARICGLGPPAPLATKDLTLVRDSSTVPQPTTRCASGPQHHPPRGLASGLSPPALHLHPPTRAEADAWLTRYNNRRRNHGGA